MNPIYRIDVRVYATLYVRAGSAEEALAIAKQTHGEEMRLEDDGDTRVSGEPLDDEFEGPAFSPVATCHGPDDGTEPEEVG